jgi:phosphoesterase RecJ-like protein
LGKDVTVYFCDPIPGDYLFLPGADLVVHGLPDRTFDVGVVLDVGEFRRAGREIGAFKGVGTYINLDHHATCEEFGAINLIDPKASATGALVYRIIKAAGHDISFETALCIYTSIITDTGSFRYSNADPEAFAIAGEMISRGVNPWSVAERLYENQPRQRLELLALALSTLTVSSSGLFATVTVTLDMYEKTGSSAEFTDGFVNYPRSIHGVEVAVFFRQIEQELIKVGFRSKGTVDVSSVAVAFGGGGHRNAAGCTMTGSLDEVKSRVVSHLEQVL